MEPRRIALFGAVILLAALVLLLALRNRGAPYLPADRDHAVFTGAAGCKECHGPGTEHPQSESHPIGEDCMRCHSRR